MLLPDATGVDRRAIFGFHGRKESRSQQGTGEFIREVAGKVSRSDWKMYFQRDPLGILDVAAESAPSRRLASHLLSATVDSNSTNAAATDPASAVSAKSLAKEFAEGVQDILARQKTAQVAPVPTTAQQRALPRSQEGRPRGAQHADTPRSTGVRDGDEA